MTLSRYNVNIKRFFVLYTKIYPTILGEFSTIRCMPYDSGEINYFRHTLSVIVE